VANPGWMPPEQLEKKNYSEKADVYSFGIYLHELLSRQHPFAEYRIKKELMERKIIDGLRPTINDKWPPAYCKLIADCWVKEPEKRPSFNEIVERLKMLISSAE
jgi:serine/threonine protein kinase